MRPSSSMPVDSSAAASPGTHRSAGCCRLRHGHPVQHTYRHGKCAQARLFN